MPQTIRDLFGNEVPEYALAPAQRRQLLGRKGTQPNGFAAVPGTGPAGETCGSCEHIHREKMYSGRTFPKCDLMKRFWTHGPGSDIRVKSPACREWVRATDWSRE